MPFGNHQWTLKVYCCCSLLWLIMEAVHSLFGIWINSSCIHIIGKPSQNNSSLQGQISSSLHFVFRKLYFVIMYSVFCNFGFCGFGYNKAPPLRCGAKYPFHFVFRELYLVIVYSLFCDCGFCILRLWILYSVIVVLDKTRLLLFFCGGHFLLGPLRGPLGLPLAQMGWFGLTGRTTSWLNRTHRSAHQLRPPLINLINWLCTALTIQPLKFEEACYEKTQWREVTTQCQIL